MSTEAAIIHAIIEGNEAEVERLLGTMLDKELTVFRRHLYDAAELVNHEQRARRIGERAEPTL